MNKLEKSEVAKTYYVNCCPKTLHTGFEKYVATDGEHTMFVNSDYEPENEEIIVFLLKTINGNVSCQLYKPRNARDSQDRNLENPRNPEIIKH